MTIENTDLIDLAGTDKVTGAVILTISDHLPWDDERMHFGLIERKIGRYLDFIRSGQLREQFPQASEKPVRVNLICLHDIPTSAWRFLTAAQRQLREIHIEFSFRRLNSVTTFVDLTPYTHMIEPYSLGNVLNVGWIDPGGSFPEGSVSKSVPEALLNVAFGEGTAKCIVESGRELPVCSVCGPVRTERAGRVLLDSELWIPGDRKVYASPLLIVHYIDVHKYVPPTEYLEAIGRLTSDVEFDGEALYREKLKESGWFSNRFKK